MLEFGRVHMDFYLIHGHLDVTPLWRKHENVRLANNNESDKKYQDIRIFDSALFDTELNSEMVAEAERIEVIDF